GPWTELASVLPKRAAGELDPGRRSELLVELGTVHETRLGQPAEAVTAYENALDTEPGCTPALVGLRRIHQQSQAWPQLAQVLMRLLEEGEATPEEKVAAQVELGTVLGEHLGRPEE